MTDTDKQQIFLQLKDVLQKYAKLMSVTTDTNTEFQVYTGKPVELPGRKFPTMYFAGLIIKKNFVGFYFMPIYMNPDLVSKLAPELLKLLKGKSCFHFTKLDPTIIPKLESALQLGYEGYQERGWI